VRIEDYADTLRGHRVLHLRCGNGLRRPRTDQGWRSSLHLRQAQSARYRASG
jgi:hypothetical protein